MGILLRLLLTSVRGRIVRSFRMLRRPKYLIGSVIGVGWIGFWVARWGAGVRFVGFGGMEITFEPEMLAGIQVLVSVALALVASCAWLLPWGKLGLGLKEAELHVLLPAPLSRRQIIQYALLKNQVGLVITAAVLAFVVWGSGSLVERLLGFVGLWAVFNVWDLNSKLRGVFLLRQREIPRGSAIMRRAFLIVAVVAFWAVVVPALLDTATRTLAAMRETGGGLESFSSLMSGIGGEFSSVLSGLEEGLSHSRVASVMLQPFAWVAGPLLTRAPLGLLLALIPAAVIYVVQHELIVRSPARFEEVSLERAKKEARAKSPTKTLEKMSDSARRRQSFALPPSGPPAMAILWKNTMSRLRRPLGQTVLIALGCQALIVIALPLIKFPVPMYAIIAMMGATGMLIFPFTAGMSWQNDFRGDFRHVELVRTWPVSAERFVMAEVLSPALLSVLAAAAGAGLILSAMFGAMFAESLASSRRMLLPESGAAIMGVGYELAVPLILLGAMFMLVGVAAISSALQNLAVLFLPAWIAHGKDSARGMAALGNRLLFASALGLVFFFLIIPSTLVVGSAVALQWLAGVPWSAWLFPVWGLLAALPLLAGTYLILRAAAGLWRNMDPAEELLESGG